MGSLSLRDHIDEILVFLADDMESAQTDAEQRRKSHGEKHQPLLHTAAETHAALRLAAGFNIDQMVSEYRALRASVVKLWSEDADHATAEDIRDLTRFNEGIDQQLIESICHYTKKVRESRNLFLGILGHDLRTPLGATSMSAELLPKIGPLNERQAMLASQIVDCSHRATEIVTNLIDLTRARFGSGPPVVRRPMNMAFVSRQLVAEMRLVHPKSEINLEISGETEGEWDKPRIGQVLSNLIGNAVQYGFADLPISVRVDGSAKDVSISVHNEGVPLREGASDKIFESLTRGDDYVSPGSSNLGLGLYIVKEIMTAHGGTVSVTSTEREGTMFTASFPRLAEAS